MAMGNGRARPIAAAPVTRTSRKGRAGHGRAARGHHRADGNGVVGHGVVGTGAFWAASGQTDCVFRGAE